MKTEGQKKLEGTDRKDRKKGESKAIPVSKVPSIPSFIRERLTANQKKIYSHTAKLLVSTKVLTALDVMAVVSYSIALEVFLESVDKVNNYGAVQTYKSGATAVNGHFTAYMQSYRTLTDCEKKLGLNPYIRERMIAYREEIEDEEKGAFELLAEKLAGKV